MALDTCNIPWDDFPILFHAFDVAAPAPWYIGAPYEGCYWYLTATPIHMVSFANGCCSTLPVPIPLNGSLLGIDLFAQTAALNFKPWSWGVTSNALHLRVGNY
ncbi:MAG: hypothetical protein JNK15_23555 [Planctomycetes bacterium]|nr:hypothetical protein [Planctomycetota bacterium]